MARSPLILEALLVLVMLALLDAVPMYEERSAERKQQQVRRQL